MPMKVSPPKKPEGKKHEKVITLADFNKTKFNSAIESKPITTLSSASVVKPSTDTYDVRGFLSKDPGDQKFEVCLSKNDDLPWVVEKGGPDNTIVAVSEAANDRKNTETMCQDLDRGLSVWLESYTGIGMDRKRPVSADNPAWHCALPETDKERVDLMIKSHNKTVRSRRKREALGKPITQKCSNGFRVKRNGNFSSCGVIGWFGPRPPSLVQLLEQAYKKGFSFARASTKVKTKHLKERMLHDHPKQPVEKANPLPNVPKNTESIAAAINSGPSLSVCDKKYYADQLLDYETWLWQSSRLRNSLPPPMLHETPIVAVNKAWSHYQSTRYRSWLYYSDETNPHIDYGLEFRKDPDLGFEIYPRHSSVANAASRFAPISRFYREKTVLKDKQWEMHVANYQKYLNGIWSLQEFLGETAMLWGDDYDVCIYPGIGFHHELLLPRVPVEVSFNDEPLKLPKLSVERSNHGESAQVTTEATAKRKYQEPSENYVDNVCNYFLQKGWKNIPDMLVLVPEALDASTGTLEASPIALPTSKDIDKICRLKTG